uniref:Putative secreted protein n=1 Tax=Anopheles darlingi TaxID=43151 RepID=A0A2M4DDY0_ANODA
MMSCVCVCVCVCVCAHLRLSYTLLLYATTNLPCNTAIHSTVQYLSGWAQDSKQSKNPTRSCLYVCVCACVMEKKRSSIYWNLLKITNDPIRSTGVCVLRLSNSNGA